MRNTLDELADRGTAALRDRNVRFYLREALPAVLASTAIPPLFVLFEQFVQRLFGNAPSQPGLVPMLVAMLLTALGVALLVANWARRLPVDRRTALGLIDRAAGAEERLVTADELLRVKADGPFAAAAIEDARWFLRPAKSAEPVLPPPPPPSSSLGYGMLWALAGLVCLYSVLHPLGVDASTLTIETADEPIRIPDIRSPVDPAEPIETPPERVPTTAPATGGEPENKTSDAAAASKPTELPDEATRKEGKGGAGRSAQAQGSRGENDARGAPTQQGQPTPKPPVVKKPLKPKKKRPKKPKKPSTDKDPEPQSGDESGTTAGRGSSEGSNKNAVTSDWKSKDQVTSDEDDEIEDDEEVEDEEVDSEARGGVQPNLRDRKPPVSRDLTIGFGNQPNPNANGRGGPSQPKKSRGTASLVLGVPIPDRIKGQPNPGKTKVNQERVEPRRERAPAGTAEARTPRSEPTGPLARPALEPWMKEMLRRWFHQRRQQEKTTR